MDLNKRIIAQTGIEMVEIGTEAAFFNSETGMYHIINDTGRYIWELAIEGNTINVIIDKLCQIYNVERVKCLDQVMTFLEELVNVSLIKVI